MNNSKANCSNENTNIENSKILGGCRVRAKESSDTARKQSLIAEVLHEWGEAGEAMRYLRADGKIAWKATSKMLERLADAERDAKDELGEWP